MVNYLFFILYYFVFSMPVCMYRNEPVNNQPAKTQTVDAVSNEEAFAKKVVACLQACDKKAWLALFPTGEEYNALLQKMAATKKDGMTKGKAAAFAWQRQAEAEAVYAKAFDALRSDAKKAGLVWSKATYGGFQFDVQPSAVGNNYLSGNVWLKGGKTEFVMEGLEAIETAAGYRLQNISAIKKTDDNE